MKRRFEEKHISKENLIKKLKHSILTQKDVIILAKAHQDSKCTLMLETFYNFDLLMYS